MVVFQEHPEGGAKSVDDINVKIFVVFMRPEHVDAGYPNSFSYLNDIPLNPCNSYHHSVAVASLNNRWFGGRQIKAEGYPEDLFLKKDYSG